MISSAVIGENQNHLEKAATGRSEFRIGLNSGLELASAAVQRRGARTPFGPEMTILIGRDCLETDFAGLPRQMVSRREKAGWEPHQTRGTAFLLWEQTA